jgi:hypothetical protein
MNSLGRADMQSIGSYHNDPRLNLDPKNLSELCDRTPFSFSHNLQHLDLFKFESLCNLATKFSASPRDYFVAGSAPTPGTKFYAVPNGGCKPVEALERIETANCRVLLKRPENHDPQFRDLLETLFDQVDLALGGIDGETVERLESAVLISSGSTTTPIHFDPEIGFFSQIEGEKFYHIYPPGCTQETDMERFYVRGRLDIANVGLERLDPQQERVFHLIPGMGFHQPQNSPHWVRTGESRSISYTCVFETAASRAHGRTRAFNYCLRKIGFAPSALGTHPLTDTIKAGTMHAAVPIQFLGRVLNKAQRVLSGRRLS